MRPIRILLLSCLFTIQACVHHPQSAPPSAPEVNRPARPNASAVWISGHHRWSGGRYVWVAGHWTQPQAGRTWVPGHWQQTPRGYRWVDGHWSGSNTPAPPRHPPRRPRRR